MCFTDFDVAKVYRTSQPVARKQHKCYECGHPINQGECYYRVDALWDEWTVLATCQRCQKRREAVHLEELNRGCTEWEAWPPHGYLHEALGDGSYRFWRRLEARRA